MYLSCIIEIQYFPEYKTLLKSVIFIKFKWGHFLSWNKKKVHRNVKHTDFLPTLIKKRYVFLGSLLNLGAAALANFLATNLRLAVFGWCKECNYTIDFWDIALISKIRSYFPYFEVKKFVLHHQFKIIKPPLC